MFIIHFTNYVDKLILCHFSKDVMNSLDGQAETCLRVHCLDPEDDGRHFQYCLSHIYINNSVKQYNL
jgi:hypothetical protein